MSQTNMREKAPVRITYGNLMKIYRKVSGPFEDGADPDQSLLGKECCEMLFGKTRVGSPSRNKIRNCVTQNQKEEYQQAYNQYGEIFKHYFKPSPSDVNPGSDANALYLHIKKAWEECFKRENYSDYAEDLKNFLEDYVLQEGSFESVSHFRQYIKDYEEIGTVSDRAFLFALLTILSLTRPFWNELPWKALIPADALRGMPARPGSLEKKLEEAEELFKKEKYEDALDLLENLEIYHKEEQGFEGVLKVFNGKVHLLRYKIQRKRMGTLNNSGYELENLRTGARNELEEAITDKNIEAMLIAAREYASGEADALFERNEKKCCELCRLIIAENPEAAEECGEAAWMLYQMDDSEDEEEYLKKAALDYDYPKAVRVYREKISVSLVSTLQASSQKDQGFYWMNEENLCSEIIRQSAPARWKEISVSVQEWKNSIYSKGLYRFFLISDDPERNLRELLRLLQCVKDTPTDNDRLRFEFYIRGQEEKVAAFVDTALSRIEDRIIPVHILDDDRMAARVLSKHPVFFPIRGLGEDEGALLKLIVVGSTLGCEWIVREAFWMLTFRNKNVRVQILLIAPDAGKTLNRLYFKCPGLKEKTEREETKLKIEKVETEYDTPEFVNRVEEILKDGSAYFVVDTGSDLDNMNLAVRIRECSIRKMVKDRNKNNNALPVIVFRCKDSDIANLSCNTVVINENDGNRWYNNYRLIPYGRIDRNYHWDILTDDILEKLSLNIHLQYYLREDSGDTEGLRNDCRKALMDYYRRSYNRDSSMSVAMSLPYRFYQGILNGRRILPPAPVRILDENAFYSEEAIDHYVKQVDAAGWETSEFAEWTEIIRSTSYENKKVKEMRLLEDSEVYQMAEWEQDRWQKFMISRGWIRAGAGDMEYYYDAGNESQQLYIGRMHPCLEAYADLEKTDRKYMKLSSKKKDFQMVNITAIRRTKEILELRWLQKAREAAKSRKDSPVR